jgi:hypothetical protein
LLPFNWVMVHSALRSSFERGRGAFRGWEERRAEGRAALGVDEILRTAWEVNLVTGGVTRDMMIVSRWIVEEGMETMETV